MKRIGSTFPALLLSCGPALAQTGAAANALDATRESVHTAIPAGDGSHRFIRLKIAAP